MKCTVLVVAHRTATSDDLLAALRERAGRAPARFVLLVPPEAPGPVARDAARAQMERAVARIREAGLEAEGQVGSDDDPVVAVIEAYDPRRHDEVVVGTLPATVSHWLGIDAPARIGRATGALVQHVVAREPRPSPPPPRRFEHPPAPRVLDTFLALGYGPRERHESAR